MNYKERLLELVNKQAENEAIFFQAKTTPEAYLQLQIRMLHAYIEEDDFMIKALEESE